MKVIICGLPGPMAAATAQAVLQRGLTLADVGFSSDRRRGTKFEQGDVSVDLVGPPTAEKLAELSGAVVVDYTSPDVVRGNVELYVKAGVPFVVGTTGGGDFAALCSGLRAPCVIAPNMHKQIVALQAMLHHAAEAFPGAFSGFSLSVVESHQAAKKDTSGTAKAMVGSFNGLGVDFGVDQVVKIRDREQQLARGIPEDALNGHAFHRYELAASGSQFVLEHNVCGRAPYADGTVDAVQFLTGRDARLYTMMDVLAAGPA